MKNKLLVVLPFAFTLHVASATARDGTNDLPVLSPKVKSVAVFKNGLAFVVKAGDTVLKDGWARMDELPPATLGTLYFGTTSKSGPVTEVVASKAKVAKDTEAISMEELLAANVGHAVRLTCAFGSEARSFEGKLLGMPAERKTEDDWGLPPVSRGYGSYYQPPPQPLVSSQLVLLQTTNAGEASVVSLLKSSILSLELLDRPYLHTSLESEQNCTKIHIGGNPSHAEISVAALEKGLVWSPSYRINIADEKEAEVEMDAVFADDAENLENADVSFVVGYPNFAFADILSPMSLQQSVESFLQALSSGGNYQAGRFANGLVSQRVEYNRANFDASTPPGAGYAVSGTLPGEQGEDLYFYHHDGVTLKKGDRACLSVLKTSVPYEHLYKWEVSDSMNVDDRGYRVGAGTTPENQVWHVLRLQNTGKQPWTTASAFVLNGELPVAQDTLDYTPPGGRTFLKLTVATDVRAEQSQNEVARKEVQISHTEFDEVTVEGKLKLSNWKNKEIALEVKKSLMGEVLESPDGKVTKLARNLTSVNPNSEVEWEFSLPGGKERELTYQYKVLIAR